MSTYREIVGKKIKKVSSDPSTGTDGEMWYNSTTGTLRGLAISQAWSSGSSAITQMHAGQSFGSATDAVGAGGYDPASSPGYVNPTDEYNGSGWSAGAAIGTARYTGSGCGSQTAGLIAGGTAGGGNASLEVEEYNGTSWAEQTNLSTGHGYGWMAGIQTASIVYTGLSDPSPAAITVNAEEYNGSSWTEVGNVNTGKYGILGFGATKDTAVKVGGTSANTGVEEYNGTSWTAVNSIPANRADGMGSGSQTAGLLAAGNPGGMTSTLTYDGTNWTTSPATLSETRAANARGATITGNATGIIHHAGPGTPKMLLTEEYNSSTNVITAGAWASSGGLGTARYQVGGAGDVPAGLAFGGYGTSIPGNTNKSEEYNGATWTAGNNMNNPRGQCSGQHIGTQTAALAAGGTLPGSPNYGSACEEYDGTNWTATGALNTGRSYTAGFGTQTAGVAATGSTSPATAASEEYDGSSWTSGNSANTARYGAAGTGILTAGVIVGNYPGTGNVEEYDGTNWTTVTSYPAGRFGINAGSGTQTDCIYSGGSNGTTRTTETFGYDGTSWSTRPSLGNALSSGAAGGTSSSAFIAGGRGSPPGPTAGVTTCEEFTGETTAANIADFTTS